MAERNFYTMLITAYLQNESLTRNARASEQQTNYLKEFYRLKPKQREILRKENCRSIGIQH